MQAYRHTAGYTSTRGSPRSGSSPRPCTPHSLAMAAHMHESTHTALPVARRWAAAAMSPGKTRRGKSRRSTTARTTRRRARSSTTSCGSSRSPRITCSCNLVCPSTSAPGLGPHLRQDSTRVFAGTRPTSAPGLGSGKFDHADRLFHNIGESWFSASEQASLAQMKPSNSALHRKSRARLWLSGCVGCARAHARVLLSPRVSAQRRQP